MESLFKKMQTAMIDSCDKYKARYKVMYADFVASCIEYSKGKVPETTKEIKRGAANEASFVLINVFGLSHIDVTNLEIEVQEKNKWMQENDFDISILN